MNVLQLIDSLEAGGAERAAVNIANEIQDKVNASHLCVTRKEGLLKASINSSVKYLFLNKKKTIDVNAIVTLYNYVKKNNIEIIHAHSSSFFLATIMKLLKQDLKIIWHDHYGNSEFLNERKITVLKRCSFFFQHVFSVNLKLEDWSRLNLKAKTGSYLPNFAIKSQQKNKETQLKGVLGKRVISLANLRPQKDHVTLVEAFKKVVDKHPEWTLHCIGKNFNDDYSTALFKLIDDLNLQQKVFIYGSKPDVSNILEQGDIGVLSSISEGLPISLLEYGLHKLPVVVTDVGECGNVVNHEINGLVVNIQDIDNLEKAIEKLISNKALRSEFSENLNTTIVNNYSKEAAIKTILKNYRRAILK